MSSVSTTEPIFDHVTVMLPCDQANDLEITDAVVTGLERAGEYHAAVAFLTTADECDTRDQLLALARSLVTVIE